jgi:hypothetical protein
MRCRACDVELNDFEATRKSMVTGDYFDLCNHCFSTIKDDIFAIERYDLEHNEILDNIGDPLDKNY